VCWHDTFSQWFTIGNGTRQGGVLLPTLFARYMRDLLHSALWGSCLNFFTGDKVIIFNSIFNNIFNGQLNNAAKQ